jgi:hypothetical protein
LPALLIEPLAPPPSEGSPPEDSPPLVAPAAAPLNPALAVSPPPTAVLPPQATPSSSGPTTIAPIPYVKIRIELSFGSPRVARNVQKASEC